MPDSPSPHSSLIRIVHHLENAVLCILFSVLILLAFIQIAGRLFFGWGFSWADPVIYHLVLWLGLLGAAMATRENEHITIDIVSRFMPERVKHGSQAIVNLFSSIICALLAWAGSKFVIEEAHIGTQFNSLMPLWIIQLIIPIAFGIISIRFLIYSIQHALSLGRYPNPT